MNIKEISEKLGLSFLNEAEPSKEVEAVLSDCAAIVLCENSTLDGDALEKAKEQGVNILSSAEDAFSLSAKLSGLL